MDFIQDYTLKSLRLKQDKWNKLVVSDGQREYILSFIEKSKFINYMDNFLETRHLSTFYKKVTIIIAQIMRCHVFLISVHDKNPIKLKV